MEAKPKFKTLKCATTNKIKYIYCENPHQKEYFLGKGAFGTVFKGF